jgi:hypothetical protein
MIRVLRKWIRRPGLADAHGERHTATRAVDWEGGTRGQLRFSSAREKGDFSQASEMR